MGLSKGTVFLSARLFTERRFGLAAVTRCLSELAPADAQILGGAVPIGWYPLDAIMRYHRIVDRLYGKGDLQMCREIGRFSADWQINSFHKLLLRLKSPVWLMEKAGTMWRHYHDTGRWEIDQPQPKSMRGCLFEFSTVDEAFCLRELGWFERAVELTGGRSPQVHEPRCRARGDTVCEYSGHWN